MAKSASSWAGHTCVVALKRIALYAQSTEGGVLAKSAFSWAGHTCVVALKRIALYTLSTEGAALAESASSWTDSTCVQANIIKIARLAHGSDDNFFSQNPRDKPPLVDSKVVEA